MSIACILIAGGKRTRLLDDVILPKTMAQLFDTVLVVGEHHDGFGYKYLHVPPLSGTTNDALVKRDVGTLATRADWLFYVSDDHYPLLLSGLPQDADVVVPLRWTRRGQARISLNNGELENYCGGHGGIFKRDLIHDLPWTAGPHHRLWDVLMSRAQQAIGARFVYGNPCAELVDVEPGAEPWK